MSPEALASPWVRYELSVLSCREQVEHNVRLVLLYMGVSPDEVQRMPAFEPFQLGEIQSHHELTDADPDDHTVQTLVKSIYEVSDMGDPPVDRLVARVSDELWDVAPDRVTTAQSSLDTADDPWLSDASDVRRGFARAFCSTPLDRTYPSLQVLAQDRHLSGEDMDALVDLNVMTTFDSKAIGQLHQTAMGYARRSIVTATTRADLADIAAQTLHELQGTLLTFRFVVNGPITGLTSTDIAEGLTDELVETIEASENEDADEFLAAMAKRGHPVVAFLTSAVGITDDVLRQLEERFPSVAFVVLSSAGRPMPRLADDLGVEGMGVDLEDEAAWAQYVAHERELAAERTALRKDLLRVKRAVGR